MIKKVMLKGGIFLALLCMILSMLSSLFVYKTPHRGKLLEGLYNSSDNYNVVLMGSSHMNGGIDPNVLWNQQGITSFNYATGGQPLNVTYYLLKEVLKTHKNPIVVLDVYYLGMTTPYGESGLISNALDNMRFSENKLEAIWNCTPLGERIQYLFPTLKYHFRWSSLKAVDATYDSSSVYYTKGFVAGTDKYGKADTTLSSTNKKAEIPASSLEYLNKIIELSKTEGFQLAFINTPCDYSTPEKTNGWVNDYEALFNTVAGIAEENQIPFLDYDDKTEEIGFDFANDMNNAGHLNLWGAYKVSSNFASYLKQNYSLVDHRSDSTYAQWNVDFSHSQAASIAS